MNRSHTPDTAGHAAELPRPPTPEPGRHRWAWFLDVDGTLLEIEKRPDLVSADRRLVELLDRLDRRYDGAVALISGRSLEQLDRIFGPSSIAAAASHGLELRPATGAVTLLADAVPDTLVEAIADFTAQHPGLLLERKSFSIGVHFRERPELAGVVADRLEKITSEPDNDFMLQHGKMLVELLPKAAGKGAAIRTFMQRPPFRGRRPIFVGDDVTDENGFAAVNELDGLSVRIGDAPGTSARFRLENVAALRAWLRAAVTTEEEGSLSD